MEFGERLKVARQSHHLTQAVVATKLKVSRQTISSWETGNSYPDIDSLIALSNYYDLSLDILLKEDNSMADSLRRPIIFQAIRPVIYLLYATEILFIIATAFASQLLVAKTALYLMGILSILALIRIRSFHDALMTTDREALWPKQRWFFVALALAVSFLNFGLYIAHLNTFSNQLSAITFGCWVGLVAEEISYAHYRKTHH